MRSILDRIRGATGVGGSETAGRCECRPAFEGDVLVVESDDCDGDGTLAESTDCRATVVEALARRDAETVAVRSHGVERSYEGDAAALLVAAGRFAERVAVHDERIAERALADPLGAGRAAAARAPPVGDVAAETGLAAVARDAAGYDDALRPDVGPTVARSKVAARPPEGARLVETRELATGSDARIYDPPDRAVRSYHLVPAATKLSADEQATLAAAYDRLAEGSVEGAERAPGRAVRAVADEGDPISRLTDVLRKHTRELGAVTDLLADPAVSDVFATAPVADNPLRVAYDGDRLPTNVRLTDDGAAALASQFRRTSGRAFSRANPTLAATADAGDGLVRIAGVAEPVSDGLAFVFRDHGGEALTLPALVTNGTLPAGAAAALSVAVERAAAGLVAGTRGAGKTTLLGALLWELPPATRTVAIEDTRELPVEQLQETGRDVQALATAVDAAEGPSVEPAEALRTALRLGEGALVLGEVRGEEARVLYEAMRVGAGGSAALGTIHGEGGESVRERVVSDLGVPESSFAVTDFLVTCEAYRGADGRSRRVRSIEEVVGTDDGVHFATLYELDGDGALVPAGRIERGESRLVDRLARPDESYADVRERIAERASLLDALARNDRTRPRQVADAYARRRGESEART